MKVLQILFNPKINNKSLVDMLCFGMDGWHSLKEDVRTTLNSIAFTDFVDIDTYVVDDFSIFVKPGGFYYDEESYLEVLRDPSKHFIPDQINYNLMMDRLDIVKGINQKEYDEVWIWGGPWTGLYESRMIGKNAHWLNSQPVKMDTRNFVIMGLSYERDISCALESFCHRIEAVFFTQHKIIWEAFKALVGTVHIPPNGKRDYDFDNKVSVLTHSDVWKDNKYNLEEIIESREYNCEDWNYNNNYHLGYMRWWINHVPMNVLNNTFGVGK